MAGIHTSPRWPASHLWARRLALLIAGVLVLMLASWVLSDPVENLSTDWTAFDNAADRVFAGDDVYRAYDSETEPLPYLYPPFALWLSLPLALVGFNGSFLLSALLTAGALVAGLVLLSRSQAGDVDRTTGLVVGVASGAAISSTLIGQYSGLYVLAVGGAAHAHSRDQHGVAGAFLALLWLKPNLAVAVPVVLLWSRSWRVLRGFSVASGVLALSSLPFGLDQWGGFVGNAQMMAELQQDGVVPFRKMVTVLGSAQTFFDIDSTSTVTIGFWLVTTLVLGLAVLELWSRRALADSPVRAFGALALFIVAANPRLYFYDSTLVVCGAYGLWLSVGDVGNRLAHKVVGPLALITWLFLWGGLFVSLNRFVGPLAGLLLVVSAFDNRFPSQVAQTTPSGVLEGLEGGTRTPEGSADDPEAELAAPEAA